MYIIDELWFAIIVSIIILSTGIGLLITFGVDFKNIIGGVVGFLWGSIIPIIVWGLRYKNRYRIKFAKFLHIYDPTRGSPDFEKYGKRYYFSRAGLPDIESLLSIPDLESVDILSITSYLLVLIYRDKISEAIGRGVN